MRLYSAAAYLLLVSFSGTAEDFPQEKLAKANNSAYDGIAVMLADAYDHRPAAMRTAHLRERYRELSGRSRKQIWPWVFLNRMVGHKVGEGHRGATEEQKAFFGKLKGMDLFDETGDMKEFLGMWRAALMSAKDIGAPGVVLDLEPYNNYKTYHTEYLAAEMGREREVIIAGLVALGARMADIAAAEYPEAVVWTLFTGLTEKMKVRGQAFTKDYMSVTYVALGMLERCREKGYFLKIVSGGEWSLNYCSRDLADLRAKMGKRGEGFNEFLLRFPHLKLGGTISPWLDAVKRTGWLASREPCLSSNIVGAEAFVPLFSELMKRYEYVWIFASGSSDYKPFGEDPRGSMRMDEALRAGRR